MINFSVKKFLSFALLIGISINLPCFAQTENEKIQDFLITNDFIIKNDTPKTFQQQAIHDFLITEDFISKNSTQFSPAKSAIRDEFMQNRLKDCEYRVYKQKKYDFQNVNHLFVKVHSAKIISTKNPMNVGDEVFFMVSENVTKNGKILVKKGELVSARVETISESGTYGVAADIIIGNFKIGNTSLTGEISKEGFTHAYWVIPVSQAAGFFIPFSNYAFRFIRGGHAKITPKETFELQLPDEFWQQTKAKTL